VPSSRWRGCPPATAHGITRSGYQIDVNTGAHSTAEVRQFFQETVSSALCARAAATGFMCFGWRDAWACSSLKPSSSSGTPTT
jgi:hypothetical protein